jgi:antitoxin HicB
MLRYGIKLQPDDNGTLLVTCPALPEVTTFGDDRADALVRAVAAIEEAIAGRIADGLDVPADSRPKGNATVTLPGMTSLKTQLYRTLRASGTTRADLMRRLKWNRESVDRLFRLDHASRLDQIEAAFRALDRRLDIRVERAA